MTTRSILNNLFENVNKGVDTSMQKQLSDIAYMKGYFERQGDTTTPVEVEKSSWTTLDIKDYTCISKIYTINKSENLIYFISEILKLSERLGHHPILIIDHNKVKIRLYTKDYNDVTDIDLDMSKMIDEIYDDISFIEEI